MTAAFGELNLSDALSGIAYAETKAQCPDTLLELDFDGSIVSGSRRAVIDATQRGERLRVGWDIRRMPQRAQLTWYLQGAIPDARESLALENGVIRDSNISPQGPGT